MKKLLLSLFLVTVFVSSCTNESNLSETKPVSNVDNLPVLDISSDLSGISLESILEGGDMKLVTPTFSKTIRNIKFDSNMILDGGGKVYSTDSIVFILRNNIDLTFSLNDSVGVPYKFYISIKKENISNLKKELISRKSKLLQKESLNQEDEQVFSNSYCVKGNIESLKKQSREKATENNNSLDSYNDMEMLPVDNNSNKSVFAKALVKPNNVVNINLYRIPDNSFVINYLYKIAIDDSWAAFIKSTKSFDPKKLRVYKMSIYDAKDFLTWEKGKLLQGFEKYVNKKRNENDIRFTQSNTIHVAIAYDISWVNGGDGASVLGKAYVNGYSHGSKSSYAIATASMQTVNNTVLGHELGHLFGAAHNNTWYWHQWFLFVGNYYTDIMSATEYPFLTYSQHDSPQNIKNIKQQLGIK